MLAWRRTGQNKNDLYNYSNLFPLGSLNTSQLIEKHISYSLLYYKKENEKK